MALIVLHFIKIISLGPALSPVNTILFPQGLLQHFDLIKTPQSPNGGHINPEEITQPPVGYNERKLHAKGFLPEVRAQSILWLGEVFRLSKTRQEPLGSWHSGMQTWNKQEYASLKTLHKPI